MVMVLGEMLELGEDSAALHRDVGAGAAQVSPRAVIALGPVAAPILEAQGPDCAASLAHTTDEALTALQAAVRPGDVVLLKGSYGSGVWRLADALLGTA